LTAVIDPTSRSTAFGARRDGLTRLPPAAGRRRGGGRYESLVIFSISSIILFALGCWVTLHLHVVYYDGASRLAHAYMAVWNRPAKLAAIGFVWPPLQTLALLPFVVIKPLATSLVALPLSSALCGGVTVAVLNRTLRLIGVRPGWRYALLLLASVNPLFLDYGSNGMAEMLYLMLLTCGLHYFVSWYLDGAESYRRLGLSGIFMGLGFLARYELVAWIGVMGLMIVAVKWRDRRRWSDLEAPVLIFIAPAVYMCAVWSFISMQVVGGGPLSWFTRANNQTQGGFIPDQHVLALTGDVLTLTGRISPALWLVPAGLILVAVLRRDAFAGWLALLVLVGAGVTLLLVLDRPHTGLLQPRYNIRSLPAMVIGAGWLLRSVPSGWARRSLGGVLLAGLLAALPLAFIMELHYPYQFEEAAWATAVKTEQNQTGNPSVGGDSVGVASYERLAGWVNSHVHRDKSVLIDDGAFPDVVLLSGRPARFVTRVDRGDSYWRSVVTDPWGTVRYMIVANPAQLSDGFSADLISSLSPNAYSGGFPGTTVVFRTPLAAVIRVDAEKPITLFLGQALAAIDTHHDAPVRLRVR
jgi:hypothetical protein